MRFCTGLCWHWCHCLLGKYLQHSDLKCLWIQSGRIHFRWLRSAQMLSLSWKTRGLVCLCTVLMESDRDLLCPAPAWWSEHFWWLKVLGLCVPLPWVSSGYVGAPFVVISPKGGSSFVHVCNRNAAYVAVHDLWLRFWLTRVSFPPESPSQWLSASTLLIFCYFFSFGFNPHPLLQLCLS